MTDDLYDFPADHTGRKSFVSVRGHSKSIPKYKTYKSVNGYNYLLPEYGGGEMVEAGTSTFVMPDKPGYVSPMSRTVVEGRAAHREHMKRHDVIEVGDQPMGYGAKRNNAPMGRAGRDIARAIQEAS